MTHALHRCGSVESLEGDYVLLAHAAKVNREAAASAMGTLAEIVLDVGPSNLGSGALGTNIPLGLDREDFLRRISGAESLACAFSSREKLEDALARLKEADLGVSITVSGLVDEVMPMARELGLRPFAINMSLGVLGDTDGLPDEALLEVITMCGHSMVAASLVREVAGQVARGEMSPRQASMLLGRPCTCGLFNVDRSDQLLSRSARDGGAGQSAANP